MALCNLIAVVPIRDGQVVFEEIVRNATDQLRDAGVDSKKLMDALGSETEGPEAGATRDALERAMKSMSSEQTHEAGLLGISEGHILRGWSFGKILFALGDGRYLDIHQLFERQFGQVGGQIM